jgi:heme/copper-type cytochrome/quinol oxidase subunit 2
MTAWVIGIVLLVAVAIVVIVWVFRSGRSSTHRPSGR